MKSISIQHLPARTAMTAPQFLLLVFSVMVFIASLIGFKQSHDAVLTLQSEREQYQQRQSQPVTRKVLTQEQQSELDAVNKAISNIQLPWHELFKALELSVTEQVQLVSIQPSLTKQNMQLVAVASNVEDILAYIKNLEKQPVFRSIALVSTKNVRLRGQSKTQFELLVMWVTG